MITVNIDIKEKKKGITTFRYYRIVFFHLIQASKHIRKEKSKIIST